MPAFIRPRQKGFIKNEDLQKRLGSYVNDKYGDKEKMDHLFNLHKSNKAMIQQQFKSSLYDPLKPQLPVGRHTIGMKPTAAAMNKHHFLEQLDIESDDSEHDPNKNYDKEFEQNMQKIDSAQAKLSKRRSQN